MPCAGKASARWATFGLVYVDI